MQDVSSEHYTRWLQNRSNQNRGRGRDRTSSAYFKWVITGEKKQPLDYLGLSSISVCLRELACSLTKISSVTKILQDFFIKKKKIEVGLHQLPVAADNTCVWFWSVWPQFGEEKVGSGCQHRPFQKHFKHQTKVDLNLYGFCDLVSYKDQALGPCRIGIHVPISCEAIIHLSTNSHTTSLQKYLC